MTGVLITFNLASMAMLIWSFFSGYNSQIRLHIMISLGATALVVFSHCLTMMYFAAVGRMIREAVQKSGLDSAPIAETKRYRKRVYRMAMMAMTFVMLNTILGGGAHTKAFPVWVHTTLSVIALILNGSAVWIEIQYLIANHLLGHKVAREFEARSQGN